MKKLIFIILSLSFLLNQDISYSVIATGFKKPLFLTSHYSNPELLYVLEQRGMIWTITDKGNLKEVFLDIRDRVHSPFPGYDERGLLGLAMSPNFDADSLIYLNYINKDKETVISRFDIKNNLEEILINLKQPYSNHNGGMMEFGPDNYLYIAVGDGGSAGDPHYNAQNRENLFGTILRIDVDTQKGYSIPSTNPFIDSENMMPEIWVYGLRNPWRFSFDRETGDMYIGDVGQHNWEEINFQSSTSNGGENYGWNHYEGEDIYNESAPLSNHVKPIYFYPNNANIFKVLLGWDEEDALGCSVTGGYVYRGSKVPSLKGYYLFADYCTGRIWTFRYMDNQILDLIELTNIINIENGDKTIYISSFGQDSNGELYIINYNGSIYKIKEIHND